MGVSVITAVSVLSVNVIASPVFNDVPPTHWAHQFISQVTDQGLMIGDAFGRFRPDEVLNKFETAKILARSAGFKYENVSAAEQEFYDAAYEKHKTFMNQSNFARWDASANREIAFLLEKNILTIADLTQFVSGGAGNTEELRPLTRSQATVYITKLLERQSQAQAHLTTNFFRDDAQISAPHKPFVYYLRSLNIVTGDTNNNFNPTGAVTRAAMATMLARALDFMPNSQPNPGVSNITNISGTIDAAFANINAIQILKASGERRIYRVTPRTVINVDGVPGAFAGLVTGMTVSAVANNDELIDIRAHRGGGGAPNTFLAEVDGIVSSIGQEGGTRTVSIEVKTVNPRDNTIVTDVRTYTLASGARITRSDEVIQFADIVRGDIVTARVSGGTAHELALEERLLILRDARLLEKRFNEQTGQGSYLVIDNRGRQHTLRVSATTNISRRGTGVTAWDRLRVGDVLELTAEYGLLRDISAYGVLSTADGWIDAIHIGRFQSYIMLRNASGEVNRHFIIPESTDVYSLRVGNRMRVRLDSDEIATVLLLEEASSVVVTGYVDSVRTSSVTLTNTQPHGTNGRRIVEVDSTTVITNTRTGDHVNFNAIRTDQRLYVVFHSSNADLARTITILMD